MYDFIFYLKVSFFLLLSLLMSGCASISKLYPVSIISYTVPEFTEEDILLGRTSPVRLNLDDDFIFSDSKIVGFAGQPDKRISVSAVSFFQAPGSESIVHILENGRVYEFRVAILEVPLRADVTVHFRGEDGGLEEVYRRSSASFETYPLTVPVFLPRRADGDPPDETTLFLRIDRAK